MIFVDTGALLARYLERDQHYEEAIHVWQQLAQKRLRFFTSNFVLDETLTLLARRSSYAFAAAKAKTIYASNAFTILRPSAEDELISLDLFEKYADQKISFTDCTSFTLMRNVGLKQVFTFDKHFHYAGFEVVSS